MTDVVVLDASVAIRIVTDDEAGHDEVRIVFDRLLETGKDTVAPEVFLYEVGNVLARGKGSKRAERFEEARGLATLIALDHAGSQRAFGIASEGKLSFYDAAYVALAEQRGTVVWTEDKEILKRFPGPSASTAELRRRMA